MDFADATTSSGFTTHYTQFMTAPADYDSDTFLGQVVSGGNKDSAYLPKGFTVPIGDPVPEFGNDPAIWTLDDAVREHHARSLALAKSVEVAEMSNSALVDDGVRSASLLAEQMFGGREWLMTAEHSENFEAIFDRVMQTELLDKVERGEFEKPPGLSLENYVTLHKNLFVAGEMLFAFKAQRNAFSDSTTFADPDFCDLLNHSLDEIGNPVLEFDQMIGENGHIWFAKPVVDPVTGTRIRGIFWHTANPDHDGGFTLGDDSTQTEQYGKWLDVRGVVDLGLDNFEIVKQIADPDYPSTCQCGLWHFWDSSERNQTRMAYGVGLGYNTAWRVSENQFSGYGNPVLSYEGGAVELFDVPAFLIRVLYAANTFMWQKLTDRVRATPTKPVRRMLARQANKGKTTVDPERITVLRWAQPQSSSDKSEPSGRTIGHRYLVRGHWRFQYYPSLGHKDDPKAHRWIFIKPQIRGSGELKLNASATVIS